MTGRQPLQSFYAILFGFSMIVILFQLLDSIQRIYDSPSDFGKFGSQFMLLTIMGAFAGILHHWSAYRDLGHIGMPSDWLAKELPSWVNTKIEICLRGAAIALMLVAFSKGHVVLEAIDLFRQHAGLVGVEDASGVCQMVGDECRPVEHAGKWNDQSIFLGAGTLLAFALWCWSIGAYRSLKNVAPLDTGIGKEELLQWIYSDTLAVFYWLSCLLLLLFDIKGVALILALVAATYSAVIGRRYYRRHRVSVRPSTGVGVS